MYKQTGTTVDLLVHSDVSLGGVHGMGFSFQDEMPLKRISHLEREFRVITKQIAKSVNSADRVQLEEHRRAIALEVRAIARKLKVSAPRWCRYVLDQ